MTIDLNHGSGAKPDGIGQAINALIDAALEKRNAEQSAWRKHLGASALGAECARQIQLDWLKTWHERPPQDDYDAGKPMPEYRRRRYRYFDLGHRLEDAMAEWLQLAGFQLKVKGKDGKQFGFETAGGRFKGHIDGVLIGGPDVLTYPALWENKAVNTKTWNKLAKHGVALGAPQYAAQAALNQAYMELADNPALFTAINKDTAEIYHELLRFDGALAQRTSDRAVAILQTTDAGELMPRQFAVDHFECRMCSWHGYCWRQP